MSLTIDVNVLVARTDVASPNHSRASEALQQLTVTNELVYLFWPALVGYLRVVTHPAVLRDPLPLSTAFENVEALLAFPHVRAAGELSGFWDVLRAVADPVPARGKLIHDAHLVALMRQHGVATIWSNDRDLRRFDGIRVVDPFA